MSFMCAAASHPATALAGAYTGQPPHSVNACAGAGAVFWQLGGRSDTETAIYSTMGALLVASLFLGILNSVFVQPVIGSERQVFYRERAAGMYAVFPWYLGMVGAYAAAILLLHFCWSPDHVGVCPI